MKQEFIISIDLGGTKILSALLNCESKVHQNLVEKNEILSRLKIPTDIKKGTDGIVNSVLESISQLITESSLTEKKIKAVCLGVPGTVNPYTGIISNAPNLGIRNFNIKEVLSKHVSMPVLVENDVNLAGLGIKKFEFNDKVKNMMVVFIGTGIGSALFFDGKLYRGSSFYAGEIGHILVNQKGTFSTKNNTSTFELTASRTAIVKAIKKELKKGKKSLLNEFNSPKKALKSKNLAYAIEKNDPLAVKYITKASTAIGTVLGSITTFLNLDTIVLGGGVIEAMHKFILPKVKDAFEKAVLPEPGKNVKIVATKLGDDAPLYGGIALTEEFLNN